MRTESERGAAPKPPKKPGNPGRTESVEGGTGEGAGEVRQAPAAFEDPRGVVDRPADRGGPQDDGGRSEGVESGEP